MTTRARDVGLTLSLARTCPHFVKSGEDFANSDLSWLYSVASSCGAMLCYAIFLVNILDDEVEVVESCGRG